MCPEADQYKATKLKSAYRRFSNKFKVYGLDMRPTQTDLEVLIQVCQHEYIIDRTKSPWCKLVDNDIFAAYEYYNDLRKNCECGYKYEITRLMNCDLFKDLIGHLTNIKNA